VEQRRVGGCLTGEELALLVRDGDATRSQAAHLASCSRCSAELHHLKRVVAMAQPPSVVDPGEGFNRAVWRKIDRRRMHQRARIAMAATLSAAAIALIVLLPRGSHIADETDLVENLDLYQNLDLIENLDAVEALDALLGEGIPEG
jgi:hypothetical protein